MAIDTTSPPSSGVQYLETDERAEGQRLDNFLLTRLKGVPRSRIYRLIRKGEIRVDRKRCRPDQRLRSGNIVRVAPLRQRQPARIDAISPRLRVLLENSIIESNEHFLVINKPAGLAVHRGSGLDIGLIEALRQLHPPGSFLELVHRLDRETSGCLLVARTPAALRELQDALKARRVTKTYQALVAGHWPADCEEVDAPLKRDQLLAGERIVRVQADGKAARTEFTVLRLLPGATLLEARPVSGRTHQIRVHCQYAGHPILGDSKYLHRDQNPYPGIRKLCLHAAAIAFTLETAEGGTRQFRFHAPLPGRMETLLSRIAAGEPVREPI